MSDTDQCNEQLKYKGGTGTRILSPLLRVIFLSHQDKMLHLLTPCSTHSCLAVASDWLPADTLPTLVW